MAGDLPDWQTPVNIVAQTLATLAVDIAAQTLATLGVNIKAQDLASLAVDITAQTLSEMSVNITAQDLAELVIKISAQTVGVYIEKEWATTQDNDHSGTGTATWTSLDEQTIFTETVAAGKVVYIDGITFSCRGNTTVEERWRLYIGGVLIYDVLTHYQAPPFEHQFATPHKATAGQVILITATSSAAATVNAYANYEGRQYNA